MKKLPFILLISLLCAACPFINREPAYSLELSRTLWGVDYLVSTDAPSIADGILFSAWTRIPDPGTAVSGEPGTLWTRGNLNVLIVNSTNWDIIAIDGNSSVIEYNGEYGDEFGLPGTIRARYNANTMFGTMGSYWIGDYSCYDSDYYANGRTQDEVKDWVWVAWFIRLNNDDSFTIRQWLKFGADGEVFPAADPGSDTVNRTAVRNRMIELGADPSVANAWIPDNTVLNFVIGENNGYFWHARLEERSDLPTLQELEEISGLENADSDAWAFYPLEWRRDAPFIEDTSGNGHHLNIMSNEVNTGTVYPGPAAPLTGR
ncbi:MAG: hypothetical protein JW904_08520 [Spirochaetales bacterium]|nr:hypothetical protein [Spirochaetales bacterium]